MDTEEYRELIAEQIEAEKVPPIDAYAVLPFTVKLNYARFIIALILGFYALYLTYTLFEGLDWRHALDWKADFDWKMYSLYPHVAFYTLAVFAYFMFLFRILYNAERLLVVKENGVKFYGYSHVIKWKYTFYAARKNEKVTLGLNPILYTDRAAPRPGFFRILMGDWHARSYPSFNAFFFNANLDELTHALRYHLRQYKENNPENINPQNNY